MKGGDRVEGRGGSGGMWGRDENGQGILPGGGDVGAEPDPQPKICRVFHAEKTAALIQNVDGT